MATENDVLSSKSNKIKRVVITGHNPDHNSNNKNAKSSKKATAVFENSLDASGFASKSQGILNEAEDLAMDAEKTDLCVKELEGGLEYGVELEYVKYEMLRMLLNINPALEVYELSVEDMRYLNSLKKKVKDSKKEAIIAWQNMMRSLELSPINVSMSAKFLQSVKFLLEVLGVTMKHNILKGSETLLAQRVYPVSVLRNVVGANYYNVALNTSQLQQNKAINKEVIKESPARQEVQKAQEKTHVQKHREKKEALDKAARENTISTNF